MNQWVLAVPGGLRVDANEPGAWRDRLGPCAPGDCLVVLQDLGEDADWRIAQRFTVAPQGLEVYDRRNHFFPYPFGDYPDQAEAQDVTLQALWMSFLKADRVALQKACWEAGTGRPAVALSRNGWLIVDRDVEFPLANLIRLLSRHFVGSYTAAFAAMPRDTRLGRSRQWEEAARYLEEYIQEHHMRPAYYAAQAQAQWKSLGPRLGTESSLDAHRFLARSQDHERVPDGLQLPFAALASLAEKWDVEERGDGSVASARLSWWFAEAIGQQQRNPWDNTVIPPFPGGLNHAL